MLLMFSGLISLIRKLPKLISSKRVCILVLKLLGIEVYFIKVNVEVYSEYACY